jgi:putative membrane protein insertion efficiency factor
MKSLALGLIRFYQGGLSPVLPSSCRYYPSCSAFAYEAVDKWGLRRGVPMALRRLLHCHPWGGHGYDPVP